MIKIKANYTNEVSGERESKILDVERVITGYFGDTLYITTDKFIFPDGKIANRILYDKHVEAVLLSDEITGPAL